MYIPNPCKMTRVCAYKAPIGGKKKRRYDQVQGYKQGVKANSCLTYLHKNFVSTQYQTRTRGEKWPVV